MLINTFLDTEDFVHLYYPEDEPAAVQGCGAGARMASKYPPRPPSPEYSQTIVPLPGEMGDRERFRAPPQPEPPPHRVRAADLYPRLRTHYDEPGLDAGFTPICGEFVQWVGRTVDGGTIAMSNYRLHIQPPPRNGPGSSIPLRLMDTIEIRDLLHLMILCKNGRQLQCSFNTGDQCLEWWRRLNKAIAPIGSVQETFAAAYAAWAKEQPPTSVHRELMKASLSTHRHWFGPELERLGFTERDAWRVTRVNTDHKLCPSYPPQIIVPGSILDEDLDAVARFRAMRRIPAVVWRHRGNGAVIARSSQPEVGWLGWRSTEDERLLAAFVTACNANRGDLPPNTQLKLLIVDARSYASAVTNRARGGGCECQQYYPAADIQFMSMPNIHHVRKSFHLMRALAAEPSDITNWHSNLERTLWLQYVSGVMRAACVVGRAVVSGRPVLVHCSDGWDRTPQIVASAQLILDPFYRTLEGFRVLIEREWLDFGHKFADRCGHTFGPEDPNERSPIFLQWLDVVHQMMLQFPCSFEFNEAYLIKLGTHVHSCMFGTFLCNTGRERGEARVADITPQVWHLLRSPAYRNHLYKPHDLEQEAMWPEYSVRSMCVWRAMFCVRSPPDEPRSEHQPDPPAPPLPPPPPTQSGLKTKTRSCDNLLCEGEKRATQRRSSDPNLAPDVKKLSLAANSECENRRDCRAALTDSCVDELPILPLASDNSDTVDGLHPDHFENSMRLPRDLASGSSSLERELGGELTDRIIPDQVIDHSDDLVASDDSQLGAVASNGAHVVTNVTPPDVDTPEEPPVFVPDTYSDDMGMPEAARGSGRTRTVSITWRSVSESSNLSSNGFEINEGRPEPLASRNTSPLDNHTSEDRTNHNVVTDNNRSRENSVTTNGTTNGHDDVATNFHEVDLNGGATSSSISSESEGEAHTQPRRTAHTHTRARVASQLTLCPTSPRRIACCHCSRRASNTSGVETSGESGGSSEVCWCGVCGGTLGGARVLCVCGGAAPAHTAPAPRADPLDGLPPALDPLQARLHQIILYQKKVVDELSGQLREAREALRLTSPAPAAPSPAPHPAPLPQTSSGSGSVLGSGSSSGSASEVEVGEEARGVVWVPDSAAPRCQYCRNHFWLARRRHHCRRCGGIFCGSCSEMSSWGDCGTMRLCRRCRSPR